MGALFNTPGTQAIIHVLSKTFTHNFSTVAQDIALVNDLDPTSGISSWDFANAYGLVHSGSGSGSVNLHWKIWLDYFDANGGAAVRAAMAHALRNPGKYEAIEFFANPDAAFVLTTGDLLNSSGTKHSLVVSADTPTYDQL